MGSSKVVELDNYESCLRFIMPTLIGLIAIVAFSFALTTYVSTSSHSSLIANNSLRLQSIENEPDFVIPNTPVVPGTYQHTTLTVNQEGRLTFAGNGTDYGQEILALNTTLIGIETDLNNTINQFNTIVATINTTILGMNATMIQVDTGTGLVGGPITSTGTISIADTDVTPGSYEYAFITVDQQGRLTNASSGVNYGPAIGMIQTQITGIINTIADLNLTVSDGNVTVSLINITMGIDMLKAVNATVREVDTGTGLTGGPITTTGTIALADTAVTPGTYTLASITVDQQGRITNATSGTASSSGVTSITAGNGLTGGTITATGTIELANTTVAQGNYGDANNVPQLSIDATGRVTSATTIPIATSAIVPNLSLYLMIIEEAVFDLGPTSQANFQVQRVTFGKMVFFSANFTLSQPMDGGTWNVAWAPPMGEPASFLLDANRVFRIFRTTDNVVRDVYFQQRMNGVIQVNGDALLGIYQGVVSWFNVLP